MLGKFHSEDLAVMAEIIRELGYCVEERNWQRPADLVVTGNNLEREVVVRIGYGHLLSTGKIPGVKTMFVGFGGLQYQIII